MVFLGGLGGVVAGTGILKDEAGAPAQSCRLRNLLPFPVRALNAPQTTRVGAGAELRGLLGLHVEKITKMLEQRGCSMKCW